MAARPDRVPQPVAVGPGHGKSAWGSFGGLFATRPRVLVVDDNPAHQEDACELLGCWGIAPALAGDGAEAVALACGGDFDLILMDLQMPVMDGLEATRQIRGYEHRQSRVRAPVLAYTSCVLEEDVLRSCGVDGVLMKPCTARALQESLLRWCGPERGADLETLAGARPQR